VIDVLHGDKQPEAFFGALSVLRLKLVRSKIAHNISAFATPLLDDLFIANFMRTNLVDGISLLGVW
jgi:hypothetical protein